jgi:DUF177 domain-containing protein
MAAYLVDVRPFLEEVGDGVHINDTVELDPLVVGDITFEPTGPAAFDVMVSNAGEALVAVGSVSAPFRTDCSRCLCDFGLQITADVEGLWPRPGQKAPEDADISGTVDSEGRVDLVPLLISALVVEAPFAPLHDDMCAGLCATCGADLNLGPCDCPESPSLDHPFAALKDLVDEDLADAE